MYSLGERSQVVYRSLLSKRANPVGMLLCFFCTHYTPFLCPPFPLLSSCTLVVPMSTYFFPFHSFTMHLSFYTSYTYAKLFFLCAINIIFK
ncbi:hypothetical protein BDB00DRAFT_921358 [Zychaea mexicana]|uniref:uncharacterized protein n=1 Tax=Zychaea mexicana TaxID=64656 RepID=UPI0022FF0C64|nr:uncharacterized protein BDB00DRAFT_921358 [Zychaea mexicana]KAI9489274.1 hypothetical protein BDB00DRAFT_921358 [Zychaea mexicana]